jgi:hypothetical protein
MTDPVPCFRRQQSHWFVPARLPTGEEVRFHQMLCPTDAHVDDSSICLASKRLQCMIQTRDMTLSYLASPRHWASEGGVHSERRLQCAGLAGRGDRGR